MQLFPYLSSPIHTPPPYSMLSSGSPTFPFPKEMFFSFRHKNNQQQKQQKHEQQQGQQTNQPAQTKFTKLRCIIDARQN